MTGKQTASPISGLRMAFTLEGLVLEDVYLSPGKSLVVGSRAPAGKIIAGADGLAPMHFLIQCLPDACRVRDLRSGEPTFVNGRVVTEVLLQEDFSITAGNLGISVDLTRVAVARPAPAARRERADDDHAVTTASSWLIQAIGTAVTPIAPEPAADAPTRATYRKTEAGPSLVLESCVTGLQVLKPVDAAFPAHEMAGRLAEAGSGFLLLDANRAGVPEALGLSPGPRLIDWWLDPERRALSPLVICHPSVAEMQRAVRKWWGRDGLIVLGSSLELADVLGHLREAARYRSADHASLGDNYVFGYYWPNVLLPLLGAADAAFATAFMNRLLYVMVEVKGGQGWRCFVSAQGLQLLGKSCTIRQAGEWHVRERPS